MNLEGKIQTKEKWHDRDGKRAASAYELLCRRQHEILRRRAVSVCAKKISARSTITAASRRPGRSVMTTSSLTTPKRNGSITFTATPARTRPNRDASTPYPHPAVSHEPRIQQLSDDFARLGLRPFHTPLGVMLDEKNPHASKCIRCGHVRRIPVPDLCQVRRPGMLPSIRRCRHANVTLMTDAYVETN